MNAEQANRLRQAMEHAFPEAAVTGHEPLVEAMKNAADDRHVAAAAIKAGAQVIVTGNLKHFRDLPEGIEAQSPDHFLCNILDLDPEGMIALCANKRARSRDRPGLWTSCSTGSLRWFRNSWLLCASA